MKRIVKMFAVAGLIIPIILLVAKLIELYINVKEVPVTGFLWPYLWPSSILLGLTHSIYALKFTDWLILGISIGVNVLLYAFVGLIIAFVWTRISGLGK
jgi:hypothetical protein